MNTPKQKKGAAIMSNAIILQSNNNILEASSTQPVNEELFTRWIAYIDASPKTVQTYTRAIKQFLIYLQAHGITEPQRADIIAYRAYLEADHKPTTVQSYLAAVKLFFRWTEQEHLYPNVADRVKGAKIDAAHKKDYLTTKQIAKILKRVDRSTIKGKRDYAILTLMVTTGLRTISIIAADVGDLRNAGNSTALYYQGKGHQEKAEYVKIAEPVEEALRDYLTARGRVNANDPLFASEAHRNSGDRMTTRSISRLVKEAFINAGFDSDRLTAHSLRHTAATLNLLNGGTIEETRQLLNHKSINTTLIYSHALERAKNNSESRIAKAILG